MVSDAEQRSGGIDAYFQALQQRLLASLGLAGVMPHSVAKGDETEGNWGQMLDDHLPRRYQAVTKCFVVDHTGATSDELDIVLCDRQYSTLVFSAGSRLFVPAEAVYAVFEVKPRICRENVLYAAAKAKSVRCLKRTSAPIVDARGRIDEPKLPQQIFAGLLTTGSDWVGGLGSSFTNVLADQDPEGRLDLGCVLSHGGWIAHYAEAQSAVVSVEEHALVSLYLRLLSLLQGVGTVPAMDYGIWGSFLRDRPTSGSVGGRDLDE